MAINTITYADKSAIYTNASIPDTNKVKDSDMNEIKTVVNTNANLQGDLTTLTTTDQTSVVGAINEVNSKFNYSTTETIIGTWNGSTLYRKVINTGQLPNNNQKLIAHNISNLSRTVRLHGFAYRSTDKISFPLPYASGNSAQVITVYSDDTNITIITGQDRSNIAESYITLEYTKTS